MAIFGADPLPIDRPTVSDLLVVCDRALLRCSLVRGQCRRKRAPSSSAACRPAADSSGLNVLARLPHCRRRRGLDTWAPRLLPPLARPRAEADRSGSVRRPRLAHSQLHQRVRAAARLLRVRTSLTVPRCARNQARRLLVANSRGRAATERQSRNLRCAV